jgi:hypothetical protein
MNEKPGRCHQCEKVPQALAWHLMAQDQSTIEETVICWSCCGLRWPVLLEEMMLWCQAYLEQNLR